jgi:hypothetical protein
MSAGRSKDLRGEARKTTKLKPETMKAEKNLTRIFAYSSEFDPALAGSSDFSFPLSALPF